MSEMRTAPATGPAGTRSGGAGTRSGGAAAGAPGQRGSLASVPGQPTAWLLLAGYGLRPWRPVLTL
jgi:hypothetical protein